MKTLDTLNDFSRQHQRRLNDILLIILAEGWLLATPLLASLAGLGYVLRGCRAPVWLLLVSAVGCAALCALIYNIKRITFNQAAHRADDYFGLQQGLISALAFHQQGYSGPIYARQIDHTLNKITAQDPNAVPFVLPRKLHFFLALSLGSLFWVFSQVEAPHVTQERVLIEQHTAIAEEVQKLLKEELEKIEAQLNEEEKEWLSTAEIREALEALEISGDFQETLKQLSQMEQTLQKQSSSASRESAFWESVGARLKDSQRNASLGKELSQKQYTPAYKNLMQLNEDLSLSEPSEPDLKAKLNELVQALQESSQQSASTPSALQKAIAKMQTAGEAQNKSLAFQEPKPASAAQKAESSQKVDAAQKTESSQKTDNTQKADASQKASAAQKAESNQKADAGQKGEPSQTGQPADSAQKADAGQKSALSSGLGELSDSLKNMGARQAFGKKMQGLLSALASSQQAVVQGALPNPSPEQGKEGEGIGSGAGDPNKKAAPSIENEALHTALTGQKNEGESSLSVEDAAHGSAHRSTTTRKKRDLEYRHSMEALIQREDIPEELKGGIREYFTLIHELTPSQTKEKP
jgi:hypothetical protein